MSREEEVDGDGEAERERPWSWFVDSLVSPALAWWSRARDERFKKCEMER